MNTILDHLANTVSYETLKHDTILTIDVDPLRLNVPITENELKHEVSLKTNEYFRIRGLLLDSSLNIPLPSKRIYFEKDFGAMVYATTDKDGTYHIENLKAPELFGKYKITARFEEDDKYRHSKSSEIIVSIQEPVKNQDIKIADNSVKISLSLQELPDREISILQAFRLFHAFTYIENGFNEEKEHPQIMSTVWLLSLLQFNPIPLGLRTKNGENLEVNGNVLSLSADILASNNEGYSLVIDCTVTVPSADKLNKLLNTSKYILEHSGKKFIPVVITNKDVPIAFEHIENTGLKVIDKTGIDELLKLIMSNNIEQAKELFLEKITGYRK